MRKKYIKKERSYKKLRIVLLVVLFIGLQVTFASYSDEISEYVGVQRRPTFDPQESYLNWPDEVIFVYTFLNDDFERSFHGELEINNKKFRITSEYSNGQMQLISRIQNTTILQNILSSNEPVEISGRLRQKSREYDFSRDFSLKFQNEIHHELDFSSIIFQEKLANGKTRIAINCSRQNRVRNFNGNISLTASFFIEIIERETGTGINVEQGIQHILDMTRTFPFQAFNNFHLGNFDFKEKTSTEPDVYGFLLKIRIGQLNNTDIPDPILLITYEITYVCDNGISLTFTSPFYMESLLEKGPY